MWMNTHHTYTTKAEKYAKYRWDYASEAVESIFSIAQLTADSIIADIGAGTGILTRHFTGRVRQIYAIEPNAEMRREAARRLPVGPGCIVLGGSAEQIPLGSRSVDLLIAAQAVHWFNPAPTRCEFQRVLRPGGWLALVRNYPTADSAGDGLQQALAEVCTAENGVSEAKASPPAYKRLDGFYFGGAHFQKLVFPFSYQQDWESFIGSLCSASYMPDETHPAYPRFEQAVRGVFERYCQNGRLPGSGATELLIGQVKEGRK